MKALIINPVYRGGGAERCARELFDLLPTHGVTTRMWTAVRRPGDPDGVESLRFPLERYGLPLDWLFYHTDWRHLGSRYHLGRLDRRRFDVVHMHNIHGNWASIRAFHELCERMPVVWTLHDEWAPSAGLAINLGELLPPAELKRLSSRALPYYETRGVRRLRRLLSRSLPQPRAIVCPSAWLAGRVTASGRFPSSRVRHIPNGLLLLRSPAIDMPRAEARARWKLPPDVRVVLLIAHMFNVAHKGADLGVEVLRRQPGPRPHVIVLGRNTEALARRLADFPLITGFAADDVSLASAYRAADVTLVPSRADNLPFVVLESFACETPIAAFAVGGIPEMLGDEGRALLAPPFDVAALARSLAQLFDDAALRRRLGESGRRFAIEHCDFDRYLERVIALYREITS